jgi:hypothetical protein
MNEPRTCYVIMPFQERYTATYKEAIRPAVEMVARERGEPWKCLRSDDIHVPGSITKEIVTSLHTADFVIADLTGHNPNVFYELGVVHSAGRPTIMITQQIQELPFDINTYRVHPYEASRDGLRRLSEYLRATILDALSPGRTMTNPVLDFAPVRHAHIILLLDDVKQLEQRVASEVWVIEPSLDTDLKILDEVIKYNLLERGIKYRYLVPRTRGIIRQWERFVRELGYDGGNHRGLEVRTVEPYVIESEVVIYDPYARQEDVLIMSSREQEFVFWYRVGKTRGEGIRDRYDVLWETESKRIDEAG